MIWFLLGAIPFIILTIFGMVVDEAFRLAVLTVAVVAVILAAFFSMGYGAHQMGWI